MGASTSRLAAALLFLLGADAASAQPLDPVFERRFESFLAGGYDPLTAPVDWYDAEPVAGVPTPVVKLADPNVSATALNAAAAWAEAQGSTALIVARGDGRVIFERYWHGDGRDTRFNPQSMSKTLVALLVGQAIARKEIGSVDDPLGRYLREWRTDPRGRITLRQAMTMSTGLAQITGKWGYQVVPENPGVAQTFGSDFLTPALGLQLEHQPGSRFDYNNNAVLLVAEALERATGKRYAQLLSERLWRPLGLKDASIYLDRPGGNVMSSCCVFSRPVDWARIGALIARRGSWHGQQLVPATWIDEMSRPSPGDKGYGYYLWLGDQRVGGEPGSPAQLKPYSSEPFAAPTQFLLGHGLQRVWIVPSRDLVIVRAGRSWPPSWDEAVIVNTILRGMGS